MTRLYFAGFELAHEAAFRAFVKGLDIRDVLITFEHSGKFPPQKQAAFYRWVKEAGLSVMVDSGVFTLAKQPEISRADLMAYYERYAHYLLKYRGAYECAINLDVDKLVGFGPAWSDDFHHRLTRQGLPVLPVWHFREAEDFKRLDKMATTYERIALGVNGMRTKKGTKNDTKFRERLDYIYARYPDNKFHLLGLTDPSILMRYPVHSGDSSTWVQKAKYGDVVYWNAAKLKVQYVHRAQANKLRDIVPRFAGHNFSVERALGLCGTGTEAMRERGKLALQAFIFMRDFINSLWEKKHGKEKETA